MNFPMSTRVTHGNQYTIPKQPMNYPMANGVLSLGNQCKIPWQPMYNPMATILSRGNRCTIPRQPMYNPMATDVQSHGDWWNYPMATDVLSNVLYPWQPIYRTHSNSSFVVPWCLGTVQKMYMYGLVWNKYWLPLLVLWLQLRIPRWSPDHSYLPLDLPRENRMRQGWVSVS